MKKCNHRLLVLFLLIFSLEGYIHAQVTIGASQAPVEGALLQVKENNNNSANSTKGIGLPRVKLEDAKNLYPMFQSDGSGGYVGAVKADEDANHVGLIVYATSFFCNADEPYYPGMYVWTGGEWSKLYAEESVATFRDGEGNTYTYKDYGGTKWMTQNLRTIYKQGKPANGPIDGVNGVRVNTLGYIASTYPVTSSPLPNGPTDYVEYQEQKTGESTPSVIRLSYEQSANKFGLLYNWAQAQDACPDGWRLPAVADWINLAVFLGDNSWDGMSFQNVGRKLKARDDISYSVSSLLSLVLWDGNPLCPPGSNAEFNALPAGDVAQNGGGSTFTQMDSWWTPVSGEYFYLYQGTDALNKYTYRVDDYRSVRCVQ